MLPSRNCVNLYRFLVRAIFKIAVLALALVCVALLLLPGRFGTNDKYAQQALEVDIWSKPSYSSSFKVPAVF